MPTFTDDWTTIYHGDCLTVMASMEACSIDAIVTDPPYGLSFMGREWDHGVPGEAFWAEALRVAKPGAHLVAFGGTRTYHRLAVAIEDAGWEVRDCLGWLYGSGFPKSLDVSKAIDKGYGENRARQLDFTAWMRSTGVTAAQINAATDSFMGSHYLTDKEQAAIATADMFDRLRHLLPDVPEHIERLVAERTGIEWTAFASRDVVGAGVSGKTYGMGGLRGVETSTGAFDVTAPATPDAIRWQGWGTALKPAWEPCILARKPLTGTVAGNVQRWGTGAINIDGCRVEWASDTEAAEVNARTAPNSRRLPENSDGTTGWGSGRVRDRDDLTSPLGRWPANIVHDGSDEVLAVLGDQARFFYTSKASKAERDEGLRFDRNTHPTVKPLDLMRWLVRLVTPPDGIVLDPFMGSGTTLKAARAEGHRSIGIDLEREHCEIAWGRLSQGVLL